MFALLVATVLAVSDSSAHTGFATVGEVPRVQSLALQKITEAPTNRPTISLHIPLIDPVSTRSPSSYLSVISDYVPYVGEMNDWYQLHRADRRWRHGVGLTLRLGKQQHRWTLGLGPIQFTFGGFEKPPDPVVAEQLGN